MREDHLAFAPPWLGEEEISEVVDVLRSGWITTGPRTDEFERAFAAAVGAPAACAVNSGTAALHVALAALGIGPGDAVVTTPMTFCSTVHVIEQVGARPVLVDVEPDTLNIDPQCVADSVQSKAQPVRVLLPVHFGGHPCDMDVLGDIAALHDLAVVEDAAHALPGRVGGRIVGAPRGDLPSAVAFSFYATKNMTTGEGGMLVGSEAMIEEARLWALHGMDRDSWRRYEEGGSWYYEVVRAGFKYNMTDIQAALGLVQLRKLGGFHHRRREIAARYNSAFAELDALEVPVERSNVDHAWHLYVLRLHLDRLRITRAVFIEELAARNISSSVHFIPVHRHPYYRDRYGFAPGEFPVAEREYERMVSLPIYPRMSDRDADDVIGAVRDVVETHAG